MSVLHHNAHKSPPVDHPGPDPGGDVAEGAFASGANGQRTPGSRRVGASLREFVGSGLAGCENSRRHHRPLDPERLRRREAVDTRWLQSVGVERTLCVAISVAGQRDLSLGDVFDEMDGVES